MNVRIVEELTLAAFTEMISRPPSATILFAHWSETDGTVELADGVVSSEEIVREVPVGFVNIMDLCICHPTRLVVLLKQKCPECLIKYSDTKASPLAWIYVYQAMFKILETQPDYFQAVADAFAVLATSPAKHETTN